jgi:hypothetical protein
MPPPRRRLAKPVSSPRYLTLRHGRELIKAHDEPAKGNTEVSSTATLDAGFTQFYSADVPGLRAGTYTIEAKQTIKVSTNNPSLGQKDPTT